MKTVKCILILLIFGFSLCVTAQDPFIGEYITEGLENNLALLQKQDEYEKSLQALRSAKGLFYPDLSIDARYTVAQGGRIIDFPVGDLLNPIYSALYLGNLIDTLIHAENQDFPFYRQREQETKLTLVQPVFNPKIIYNYQIKREGVNAVKTDVTIYKRELILEIKTAYYNYLKTVYLLKLVDETSELLKENLRVSKSLYKNDKVTSDVVYRSEAEIEKLRANRAGAEKAQKTAGAYFNFLLNKPLESKIRIPEYPSIEEIIAVGQTDPIPSENIENREELAQLETYKRINEKYLNLSRSSNYPNIFLAVNYGIQGEEYSFTANDDFMLASVVLQWDLFQGFKNRADVQQAKIAGHQLEMKQQEVQKQLELQAINAYYDLQAAAKSVEASRAEVEASEKAFRVVSEKYKNGLSPLIEFTDARTHMTGSRQNLIIACFEYKIKEAELERATASATLP